jgi:hypothetical protein
MMLTTQRRAKRGNKRRRSDVVGDRCSGRSLKTAAVLLVRRSGKKEWAVLAWRAYMGEERKREEGSRGAGHFTDGKKLRRPAMAAASTSRGDGAREDGERCGRGEKGGVGLGRDFYRAGRGEGMRRPEDSRPSMARASPAVGGLMVLKGGRSFRGNQKGLRKGSVSDASLRLKEGN